MGKRIPIKFIFSIPYRLVLGFEEFLDDDGLTVIEWSQYVPSLLPDEYLSVSIRLLQDDRREFDLEANGAVYEQLLEDMK